MTQIRRILQLRNEGVSKLKISRMINIHRKTLDDYLFKFDLSGKSYKDLLALSDQELGAIVYSYSKIKQPDYRLTELEKKFTKYQQDLKISGVTRRLLWEEYRQSHPDGYSYTQFCEHFARYLKRTKATMHFEHHPGEYLQVDFAGKPLTIVDRQTGEVIPTPVLVCVLPFSGYPYVEALSSTRQEDLFAGLNRCLEFLGGVPRNILSDNMSQYVVKNSRYEFTFTDLASQWSVHYNTHLEATRPGKPKDKPSVESAVNITYLRIYARLRNETFYNLDELNTRIQELIKKHIHIHFQKKPGTRYDLFTRFEKPTLKPLPANSFIVRRTTRAKVQMNYHVVLGEDNHRYSVPHQYIGQQTKIVYDRENVEVFIGLKRIATHKRNYRNAGYTTLREHMPEKHLKYEETRGWNAGYFISLATNIGESAEEVFRRVLSSKEFVEQTYLSCKGLKRLSEIYTPERFEAACRRALKGTRVNYRMIKNILEKNLDKQENKQSTLFSIPKHNNIRGKSNYK